MKSLLEGLGDIAAEIKAEAEDDNEAVYSGSTGGLEEGDSNSDNTGGTRCEINLLSHCVFCLRETTSQRKSAHQQKMKAHEFDLVKVVPSAQISASSSSALLSTLNQLWPYLQKRNGGTDDADGGTTGRNPSFLEAGALFSLGGTGTTTKGMPSFTDLPEMCQFCAEKLKSAHKQLVSLIKEMEKLEKVIRDSKYGGKYFWRAAEFEQKLKDSALEGGSIEATIEFLGKLGKDDPPPPPAPKRRRGKASHIDNPEVPQNLTTVPATPILEPLIEKSEAGIKVSRIQVAGEPDHIKSEPDQKLEEVSPNVSEFEEDDHGKTEEEDEEERAPISTSPVAIPRVKRKGRKQVNGKPKKMRNGNPKKHKCDLCNDMVPSAQLYAHVQEHVGDDYCIKCPNPTCSVVYSQPLSISWHLDTSKSCRDSVPRPEDLHKFPILKRHIHKYICEICDHTATNCFQMRSHLNEKHETDAKNLACPVSGCERRFSLRQSVVLHLPLHDFNRNMTSQRCDHCNNYTRLKCSEMEQHLKDDHQVEEIIKCNQCAFVFSSRELLLSHLYQHRYGVLTCDICNDGVKFQRHSKLLDHYFTEHKIGERFQCELCEDVWYLRKSNLLAHNKRVHSGRDEDGEVASVAPTGKAFKCEICEDKVYKSFGSLREHNIKSHGADKFKCKFCGQEFTRRQLVQDHERSHKGLPVKEYPCQVPGCGKTFKQNKLLKRHHSVTHLGIRAHVCEICGKTYTDESSLRTHRESVHLGLRPFVCNTCGESFTGGTVLKRHMRIHTDERAYGCDICGHRFRHKEVLKTHLEGHQKKGSEFRPTGPIKRNRKRVEMKKRNT